MRIHEDRAGTLYFSTRSSGVNRYDPASGRFETFLLEGDISQVTLRHPVAHGLGDDRPGRRPAVARHHRRAGLRLLDPKTRRLETFRHAAADPSSLGNDQIFVLFHDRRDRIFVGHAGGLDRYLPESRGFEHVALGLPGGVGAIGEDAQGNLWAFTSEGGASSLLLREERRPVDPPRFLALLTVNQAVLAPDGSFFIGTYGDGLYRFDPADGLPRAGPQPGRGPRKPDLGPGDGARASTAPACSGSAPATDSRSTTRAAPSSRWRRLGRGLPVSSVGAIQIDRHGEAWLASLEGELIRWDPRAQHLPQAADRAGWARSSAFAETRAGTIWVGAGSGLYRLDPGKRAADESADRGRQHDQRDFRGCRRLPLDGLFRRRRPRRCRGPAGASAGSPAPADWPRGCDVFARRRPRRPALGGGRQASTGSTRGPSGSPRGTTAPATPRPCPTSR